MRKFNMGQFGVNSAIQFSPFYFSPWGLLRSQGLMSHQCGWRGIWSLPGVPPAPMGRLYFHVAWSESSTQIILPLLREPGRPLQAQPSSRGSLLRSLSTWRNSTGCLNGSSGVGNLGGCLRTFLHKSHPPLA